MPTLRRVAAVAVAAAVALECKSPTDPPDPPATDAPDTRLFVTAAPDSVALGALGSTAQLRATVADAAGGPVGDVPVRWAAVGTSVVRVDPDSGVVTAVRNGVDTILAQIPSDTARVVVRVRQVPAAVSISALDSVVTTFAVPFLLTAAVRDSLGHLIVFAPVEWRSADTVVVRVTAGVVTAHANGVADVIASSGAVSDSVAVTVFSDGEAFGAITGRRVECVAGRAAMFPCDRIALLSFLPNAAIGAGQGINLNDVWGWTDPQTGGEYALVARSDGISFVDVTDPLEPTYLGDLPKTAVSPASTWRDVKVYDDHAFVVADGAGAHGMQVFDLRQLRAMAQAPVRFTESARYDGVFSVHNLAINEETGYAYAVASRGGGQTCGGGLHMIDIRDPLNPVFAGCFADVGTGRSLTGTTHDAMCAVYRGPDAAYTGREICFGSNETALSIADVTDKSNPVAVARSAYPNVGYAHQGWITPDHRYFFMNDELDELQGTVPGVRTLIWDVSDLDDPLVVREYIGPTQATDHNLYVNGGFVYQSNYAAGIRIIDIASPQSPVEAGFFDTVPTGGDDPGFRGSWSNYPFFASGNVVVTSREEGVFVIALDRDR